MRIFITGATGFVGRHLARALAREGHAMIGYCRPESATRRLEGLPIEWVRGDLTDVELLTKAMKGCDAAFHVAAMISYKQRDREKIYQTNVGVTRAVAEAALRAEVGRVVHTSSIAACAHSTAGAILNESAPWNSQYLNIDYFTTKHLAEREVLAAVERGLDAVIVNPGTIFGPESEGNSEKFMIDLANGKIRLAPAGGTACAGVDDVVAGHLLALTRGRRGERYVLGGENLTWGELFQRAAGALGARAPRVEVPGGLLRFGARVLDGVDALGLRLPELSGAALRALSIYLFFDNNKSAAELGYAPSPIEEVLNKTAADLRRRGRIN